MNREEEEERKRGVEEVLVELELSDQWMDWEGERQPNTTSSHPSPLKSPIETPEEEEQVEGRETSAFRFKLDPPPLFSTQDGEEEGWEASKSSQPS